MPWISVRTSRPSPELAEQTRLLEELSRSVAEAVGKDEKRVMTCFMPQAPMTFGGQAVPACFVELKSVGTLTAEQTADLSRRICAIVQERLGVPADHVYIEMANAERHLWGWNGRTLA